MVNVTLSDSVRKTEGGYGMCILFLHSEWLKGPPPMKHSGTKGSPNMNLLLNQRARRLPVPARQLAKAWEEFPVPKKPLRRARSLPLRETSSMSLDSSCSHSPPRESAPMKSESHPQGTPPREDTQPSQMTAEHPRGRLRGKTQPTPSSISSSQECPADSQDSLASQSSDGRPEPYGCWDELYDVLRRPVLAVDRHIPRELKTLWQRLVMQLLTQDQSRTDVYPIASDLVFVLPKLVLWHPPGKEKARDRLQRIQQSLQQASQGEWKHLIHRVLEMPVPRYEQDESQPLVTGADSLPLRTAKRLYKAASQGQLGKAWRQLRAPPPVFVGPAQWEEAVAKLTPQAKQEGSVPLREDMTPERQYPTPQEYNSAISKLKEEQSG